MIADLEADRSVSDRYQFWTFGYSTGDPIPYSAWLLRRNLREARQKFDPDGKDAGFGRMVVVGHSMGGLLTKMIAAESGNRLWSVISNRPFEELVAEPSDRELFGRALIFEAEPEVKRVVFIATPHQGSRLDDGSLQLLANRLVRLPDPLKAAHERVVKRNSPDFFKEHFRKGLPTSIDELHVGAPMLTGIHELPIHPAVKTHSIIAIKKPVPEAARTDGLVAYASAHLDGVVSEKLVTSGHLCQDHPEVIGEVRRILVEHAAR
jgi:pimeloyl-ACP methyl ester carboxylesterase